MIYLTANHLFGTNQNGTDEELISNWNNTVKQNDTVYHLGNFTPYGNTLARYTILQLNGNIKFVSSPFIQDYKWILDRKGEMYIDDLTGTKIISIMNTIEVIEYEGEKITLCYFPLEHWNGRFHFFGSDQHVNLKPGRLSVSLENWGCYPISIDELVKTAKHHLKEDENEFN